MKQFIPFAILLFIWADSFCQQIVRSSLSSFGNSVSQNGVLFRQTVGQPSNSTVVSKTGTTLRQGFQQPISYVNSSVLRECTLYLSPNPTYNLVTLKFLEPIGEFQVSVYDLMGKLQLQENAVADVAYEMDIKKLSNGVYLLNISSASGYRCSEKLVVLL